MSDYTQTLLLLGGILAALLWLAARATGRLSPRLRSAADLHYAKARWNQRLSKMRDHLANLCALQRRNPDRDYRAEIHAVTAGIERAEDRVAYIGAELARRAVRDCFHPHAHKEAPHA